MPTLALLVESWIWWSVVIVVAISRFISRRMTFGTFRKFQTDDYLMVVVLCFYTALIATINIVRDSKSNLLPPGYDVNKLTPQNIQERQYGSKLILVVEQCQCVTVWGVKGCLVLLYMRLTTFRKENIAIKVLAAYIVISFVVMDILYFGVWCQPFHNYWAVPTPNPQCDAATNHLIINAVFNLTSDCAMLAIGLPMFLRMNLPWKKKIPLIGIFSLGVFTILSAILNKVYSFSQPFGAQWTYWYTRESSTALLVANLPFVWTLWRRMIGIKTVDGQSRQNSYPPEDTKSPTVNGDANPTETKTTSPTSPDKLHPRGSDGNFEMEGGVPLHGIRTNGSMTLAEMLGDENPSATTEKEPTPITHPHLFYGRNRGASVANHQSSIEKMALDDELEGSEDFPNTTPAPSVSPDLKSKESANSFV